MTAAVLLVIGVPSPNSTEMPVTVSQRVTLDEVIDQTVFASSDSAIAVPPKLSGMSPGTAEMTCALPAHTRRQKNSVATAKFQRLILLLKAKIVRVFTRHQV